VREEIALSADGGVLTMTVRVGAAESAADPAGPKTSRLAYTRTRDVGPCEKWPTPCKR